MTKVLVSGDVIIKKPRIRSSITQETVNWKEFPSTTAGMIYQDMEYKTYGGDLSQGDKKKGDIPITKERYKKIYGFNPW